MELIIGRGTKIKKSYKKYIAIIIPSLVLISSLDSLNISAYKKDTIENNVEILSHMEKADISQIEEEIEKVRQVFNQEENTLNYKDIFKNSVFMGDSQTEGLKVYNVLNPTSVVAKKGANLVSSRDNISTLSNLNPSNVFLLYGMNDILIYKEDIDSFINDYSYLVKEIKQKLPNTQIIVNAIFPVDEAVLKRRVDYKKIDDYNKKLNDMCEELEVQFIDTAHLLKEDNTLFEGDGMHLKPLFYTKWINILIKEVNL